MVRAWFMDNSNPDYRSECQFSPESPVSVDQLKQSTGVLYWKLDSTDYENNADFNKLCEDRGYNYRDLISIDEEHLPDLDEKLKMFYTEHLHADEEIRYFIDGSAFFDVRDKNDKWIRIFAQKDDLLVLPAGIYHRFTPDKSNRVKVCRLFVGKPVWTAINRPADDHPARMEYIKSLA